MTGITIKEAAKRLGITERQVRSLIDREKLRWRRVGKYIHLHPHDVAEFENTMWQRGRGAA